MKLTGLNIIAYLAFDKEICAGMLHNRLRKRVYSDMRVTTTVLSLFVTVAAQHALQEGGMLQQHSNNFIIEMRGNVLFCLRVGWGIGMEKVLVY